MSGNNKTTSIFNLNAHYDTLCNMVIRPPRYTYDNIDMGPKSFKIGTIRYLRKDFELINPRGHTIQCSHFLQEEYWESGEKQPCVIYCHGNSGCRLDGLECVRSLLPMNITVIAFDFSGSGMSGGEYVSLGYYEKDDVQTIVKHLRETGKISTIGLWGRSMGAVTSILYAKDDPSVAGMVLDSPFSSLYKVAEELVQSAVQKVPKLMISVGLKMIRSSIKKKAHFDIKDLDITSITNQVFIPALFAHGKEDTFVRPHHSEVLFNSYAGDKNRLLLDGDHNGERPNFFFESVCIFFVNTLRPNLNQSKSTSINSNNTNNISNTNGNNTIDKNSQTLESIINHNSIPPSIYFDSLSLQEEKELEQVILLSMRESQNSVTTEAGDHQHQNTINEQSQQQEHQNNIEYDGDDEYDEEILKQQQEIYDSLQSNHSKLNNNLTQQSENLDEIESNPNTTTSTTTTTTNQPTSPPK